jgi:hypothetical protein
VEEALAARAADQWAIVQSATARVGQAPAMDAVVYVPRHQAPAAAATASRFDAQKRDRLRAWLRKHAADADLLIFDNRDARLGHSVPKAIDTLMRQFAHEPSFQRLLLTERHRRTDREILSGFALSSGTGRASSGLGKPRWITHPSPSSAPFTTTVQTPPIPEPGEAEPSPTVLGTTSVTPIASPMVAPSAHIAARQADRKPDNSGSPPDKQPNRVAPSGPDRAASTATKDGSTERAPPALATAEKSKASIFDQASSLQTADAKRVAPKGPASSAPSVSLPTKGTER